VGMNTSTYNDLITSLLVAFNEEYGEEWIDPEVCNCRFYDAITLDCQCDTCRNWREQ
jgi:hypothetical protein